MLNHMVMQVSCRLMQIPCRLSCSHMYSLPLYLLYVAVHHLIPDLSYFFLL